MVTPGFIDGHTHMDAQVFWDATGRSSCWHGVTTAVMGNCGFTLAPVRSDERALVVRNLERAEDIDPAALAAGIDWSFETFPEYLDAVDRLPKGINFAANIGHSALRTWAMGERAFEAGGRPTTTSPLMAGQLARGAPGRGHRLHHLAQPAPRDLRRPAGGVPPGVVGRGGRAGRRDGRPRRRHLRGRRRRHVRCRPRGPRPAALDRMRTLAADTRVPMTFGLVATRGAGYLLDFLDEAAAVGRPGASPRPTAGASRCCCRSRPDCRSTCCRRGAALRALPGGGAAGRAARSPSGGGPYVDAAVARRLRRVDAGSGAQARPPDFEGIRVYQHGLPPNPSVADVARDRGVHPAEAMIDLVRRVRRRPAVHPAQPLPPGRGRCCCGPCATPGRS